MYLIGRSACNIREIMQQTNTKIELPDPRSSTSRNGVITVTGSILAVIQARSLLVVSMKLNCIKLSAVYLNFFEHLPSGQVGHEKTGWPKQNTLAVRSIASTHIVII